jgi:hypothetical protein
MKLPTLKKLLITNSESELKSDIISPTIWQLAQTYTSDMVKVIKMQTKKYWDATNTFHFNPYFRFDFVSTEKISFGAKAEAILGFSKKKDQDDVTGKNSRFGVAIIPVLNYKFNSNWSAGVSFGRGLSWRNTVNKDKDGNKIDNDSNLGVDLRLQSLNFSVVYTF